MPLSQPSRVLITPLLYGVIAWGCITHVSAADADKSIDIERGSATTVDLPMNTCQQTPAAEPFQSVAVNYQPKYHTIAHQFLDAEKRVSPVTPEMYAILDTLIDEAVRALPPYPLNLQTDHARSFAQDALNQIDCILLRHGFVYPGRGTVQLLSDGLGATAIKTFGYFNEIYRQPHNIRRQAFIKARKFGPFYVVDCDIAAYLYVAIGEVLGYPIYLADIPNHIFVRWELGTRQHLNYETMDGLVTDDAYYRRKWEIPAELVNQGGILQPMSKQEATAYHDASIAEAWSWQHQYAETRDHYVHAIQQDASRPFALNNLAWYYIVDPLQEPDSLHQAVNYAQLAVKVFPTGDNWDTLACAYAKAKDFKRAIDALNIATSKQYTPFESDLTGHLKRFKQKQSCEDAGFGRELKPFRPPQDL